MSHHLIALDELSGADLTTILNDACELQTLWQERQVPKLLQNHRIGLIVDDDGWRNTFAFELGINELGGICAHAPIKLGQREQTQDLARYLENWCDCVVIRTPEISQLRSLAAAGNFPVINARTRHNHPCETLGDLAFVVNSGRKLDGLKVTVISPDANILRSWIEVSEVLPIHVTQVFDANFLADDGPYERFTATDELPTENVDVLITDVWPDAADKQTFKNFQVTTRLLDKFEDLIYLPCPPVHRGEEVSADSLTHPSFQSYAAKEYLLHAQNAILKWALNK